MRTFKFFVFLHVGWSCFLQSVTAYPTTTDLPSETTVIDVIYETTSGVDEIAARSENENIEIGTTTEDSTSTFYFDEPEATTTTTLLHLQKATRSQQDVVEELHELWSFSESLDERERDLKSKLNSIVHLAYARVQVEPEETLHNLKTLLRKLRSRLSRTSDSEDNNNSSANANSTRRKRNVSGSIIGLESLVTASSQLQQLQQSKVPNEQIVGSTGTPPDTTTEAMTLMKSLTPDDAKIQKVIFVDDREYVELPEPEEPPKKPEPQPPLTSSTVIETSLLMNNESGALPSVVTAEHIANAILKLLHQNSLPFAESFFAEKINFTGNIPEFLPSSIENEITSTSTTQPLITWSQISNSTDIFATNSEENEISVESQPAAPAEANLIVRTTNKWSQEDFQEFLQQSDSDAASGVSSENTNAISATSSSSSSSAIVNMFDELTANNIMMGPVAFLNGTREGMVQFINTFNILSFKTKMAILFALSVSILSIALGIYSLGPPIIAVGALGILIPILLLLVLQNQEQVANKKRKEGATGVGDPLKEFDYVLDLILDAVQKYKV